MSCSQWEEYLQSYYEQKRLEEYQNRRVLYRPKTTKISVLLYTFILLLFLSVFVVVLLTFFSLNIWYNSIIIALYSIVVMETFGRFWAIKTVECYQHYATDERRRRCKCIPSCSEYAVLCFKKYELIYALIKIRKRLFVTCKGSEYIIDYP